MSELSLLQCGLIALIFIWSGFVRSGLGFGGAVLSLPFLLLVDNSPLVYLPIIAVHLLFFSSLTVYLNNRKVKRQASETSSTSPSSISHLSTVDWVYLKYALGIIIIPKLIGVFGLITMPPELMSSIIFTIVACYALSYIFNRPFRSTSKALDIFFLMLGGYISGTSLIGAPLIIAVLITHVAAHQLRDTLFTLWFILVSIKMTAFVWAGIDLQLIYALMLLPCAGIGHVLGLKAHEQILKAETKVFFRILGSVLLVISGIGLGKVLLS
ncbi:MAG: TSUP family transporter [Oleispira sp.]|nr:TSUP family transporter [Oleispira sp.]MBL4880803.1 TSUP family transporter [Oleispira sp.]